MNQDAQRIAIAEWWGWSKHPSQPDCWINPNGVDTYIDSVPNYPLDLNAMHEAEKKLSLSQKMSYLVKLGKSTNALSECHDSWKRVTASASERCEALCRTLWPERFEQ